MQFTQVALSSILWQKVTNKQLQIKIKLLIFIYMYVPTSIHLHHICAEAHGRQVTDSQRLPCRILGTELMSSAEAANCLVF